MDGDGDVDMATASGVPHMQPFLDSTDVLNDGAELLRRAQRDGYLFLRELLPADDLEHLRMQLLEIARDGGWVRQGTLLAEAIADLEGFCLEPEPKYMQTYHRMYKLPEFHAIQHHPGLIGLFERMLGEAVLPHPRLIGRTIFPQKNQYTTPPHQDFVPIQGTPDTWSAWFSLCDLTPEMGGLQLAAGSHQQGIYDFEPALGAGGLAVTQDFGDAWVHSPMMQGDVIIFHSMTVHKGVACSGDRLRMSMDARYQRAREPLSSGSLLPHTSPEMTWNDVYADWPESDLKYYWKKFGVSELPYDESYHQKRDSLAIEMAECGDARARSVLQRIIARDPDQAKQLRARQLLAQLESTATKS